MRRTSRSLSVVVSTVAVSILVGGCPQIAQLAATGDGAFKAMTLVHEGVDFSADATGDAIANQNDIDGETIGWPPSPNAWRASDTEVWFRPTANTDAASYTKDMGAVSLASVTSVPTTWDGGPEQELPALQVGHVYVVKCLDGYAKFLVKAIRVDSGWEVDVEYAFTTGQTFAE